MVIIFDESGPFSSCTIKASAISMYSFLLPTHDRLATKQEIKRLVRVSCFHYVGALLEGFLKCGRISSLGKCSIQACAISVWLFH